MTDAKLVETLIENTNRNTRTVLPNRLVTHTEIVAMAERNGLMVREDDSFGVMTYCVSGGYVDLTWHIERGNAQFFLIVYEHDIDPINGMNYEMSGGNRVIFDHFRSLINDK